MSNGAGSVRGSVEWGRVSEGVSNGAGSVRGSVEWGRGSVEEAAQ